MEEEIFEEDAQVFTVENWLRVCYEQKRFWAYKSNCIDLAFSTMFPKHSSAEPGLASKVCFGCPVQSQCAYLGVCGKEEWGIWGGTTRSQRSRIISNILNEFGDIWENWSSGSHEIIVKYVEDFIENFNSSIILSDQDNNKTLNA